MNLAEMERLAADVGTPRTVNIFTDPTAACMCVADHNPNVVTFHRHHIWPLGMGGPDSPYNEILLCPTVHYAIHHLLAAWVKAGGEPDWAIRRVVGNFGRTLAEQGYMLWQASLSDVSRETEA